MGACGHGRILQLSLETGPRQPEREAHCCSEADVAFEHAEPSADQVPEFGSMLLGAITGREVSERVVAGAAAALVAVQKGARIVRTHDVGATRDVLRLWSALE